MFHGLTRCHKQHPQCYWLLPGVQDCQWMTAIIFSSYFQIDLPNFDSQFSLRYNLNTAQLQLYFFQIVQKFLCISMSCQPIIIENIALILTDIYSLRRWSCCLVPYNMYNPNYEEKLFGLILANIQPVQFKHEWVGRGLRIQFHRFNRLIY
jgi:hypothetical protein